MTVIYSPTPYDTPEIVALREEINSESRAFEQFRREHSIREQQRCKDYDALLAAQRPTYPTPEHLEAIDRVASYVHDDLTYGDHLGYPRAEDEEAGRALPYSVAYFSANGRINVFARAPYRARSITRAWEFTPHEIETLRQRIRDNKLRIISEWIHEDGIAFVVVDARV